MSDAWVLSALVALFLLACGVLAYAWTRGRLGVVSAAVLAVAIAAWVLDLLAITTGFRDAEGFIDCTNCTLTHQVAEIGFLASPLLVALAAAGLVVALLTRARRRRGGG